jgi:DNA-binding Lrp family transcriptional regulator
MKDVELRLISELMKGSRRSDRELARTLKVSQPTVTRIRTRLEKEGIVKEYTMIPDFSKLGYKLLSFVFVRLRKPLDEQEIEKSRGIARDSLKAAGAQYNVVMLERGIGMSYDGVFVNYHEDYASYTRFIGWLKQFQFLEMTEIGSFLVNLEDHVRYRPLTLSLLASHLPHMQGDKE